MTEADPARLRIDKWLWYARFFKTRSLATAQVRGGHVRVNGEKVSKASATVGPGDVLTFAKATHIRVIRVDALGARRGPAPEAQTLYTDLDPPKPRTPEDIPANPGFDGKGRPTGKDRRKLDVSRARHLE